MANDDARPAEKHRLRQALGASLILVSLGFVAAQIVAGWPELTRTSWRVSPALAGLSLVALLANFLLVSVGWTLVLRDLRQPTTLWRTFVVLYVAQPGRYVPGKVWLVLGQLAAAERLGIGKASVVAANVVQLLGGACGGLATLGVLALLAGENPAIAVAAFALAAGAGVSLLAAPSGVRLSPGRWLARLGLSAGELAAPPATALKFVGLTVVAWVVHCAAFVALAASLSPLDAPKALHLAYAYCLAYHIAFFVFIVPGGIGVREGALTALSAAVVGAGPAGVLALVQRFWYLAAELLSFVVALTLSRRLGSLAEGSNVPVDRRE